MALQASYGWALQQPVVLAVLLVFDLSAIVLYRDCGHSTARQVALYEAWGKPEKAEEWRAGLPQTEAVEG